MPETRADEFYRRLTENGRIDPRCDCEVSVAQLARKIFEEMDRPAPERVLEPCGCYGPECDCFPAPSEESR